MQVGNITKKVQERRLRWYGHVMRREENYVRRMADGIEVSAIEEKERKLEEEMFEQI